MPIDFPNTPSDGDSFSAGGKTWVYNGSASAWGTFGLPTAIANGAVHTSQLANGAVTLAKLDSGVMSTINNMDDVNLSVAPVDGDYLRYSGSASAWVSASPAVSVCLSTTKPSSPFVGQMIYMSDVDETAVWDGTYWEGLNRSKDRNVIINGAMQVHQRGTSSSTANGYVTADRWSPYAGGLTVTHSVESHSPVGPGFRKSWKTLVGVAVASPASTDLYVLRQYIEGQNVQSFGKGTSLAKQFALSFWVQSNKTGTYTVELEDLDNARFCSASYSIGAANTWQKVVVVLPADTDMTKFFDNDNVGSLAVRFCLIAGSNYTSGGSLNQVWSHISTLSGKQHVGQTNLFDTVGNYWQVTGVQLEPAAAATPFEFESYETTLSKCQRYFFRYQGRLIFWKLRESDRLRRSQYYYPTTMRAAPTVSVVTSNADGGTAIAASNSYQHTVHFESTGGNDSSAPYVDEFTANIEL